MLVWAGALRKMTLITFAMDERITTTNRVSLEREFLVVKLELLNLETKFTIPLVSLCCLCLKSITRCKQ